MKYDFTSLPKIQFICIIIFTLFAFANSVNEIDIKSSREWCWTKPVVNDPGFILNPNNGGSNWGYCKQGSMSSGKKKEYYVYIKTSALPDSETSSKLLIVLNGSEGCSKQLTLSEHGFKSASYEKIKLFSDDVGNLKSIKIVNKGTQQYRCDSVKVESGMNYWNFECSKPIKCPMCTVEFGVSKVITYEVAVKTSFVEGSGTHEAIYITFLGTKEKSPMKQIAGRGFDQGSLVTTSVDTVDVGSLYGITLNINGYDNWAPEEIIVKKPTDSGTEEKIFKFSEDEVLTSPDRPLTKKLPRNVASQEDSIKTSDTDSLLDFNDQQRVVKLSCTDQLKHHEEFGPSFVSSNVNYVNVLAECPSGCLRDTSIRAIGIGIHPEEAVICTSAIVDRAVSFYGGVISVSIYSGIDSYTGGKKIFGIPVLSYPSSKKSFTVTKVDNLDNLESDVRILDGDGKISNKGRLEIRSLGEWGTVCAVGHSAVSADVICKQIGYIEGKFLNPNEKIGRGFCSNFEGSNHCGVNASQIKFSKLKCQGNENTVLECLRDIPDLNFCTHQFDTIIECNNLEGDDQIHFSAGSVRLMDYTGNPSKTGLGRLEILKGSFGTLCNNKFSDISARIACKQMGYLEGSMKGIPSSNEMCNNADGNNYCGSNDTKIQFTDVQCQGHEKTISDCNSNPNTVACTHFNDVVVSCEGFGDPTGKSQNIRKPKVQKPLIKKLPMVPTFNANCESTGKNIFFRGDPGSIYMVNCPRECLGNSGIKSVTGFGVYTIDSSICLVGIQSGVVTNEGGNLLFTKTYGQNKYYSSNIRAISSLNSNYSKVSFFVSAANSAYFNMVSMINDGASFLELQTQEKLIDSSLSLEPDDYTGREVTPISSTSSSPLSPVYSSFIQILDTKVSELVCVFEWTTPNSEFVYDKSYIDLLPLEGSNLVLDLKTFTIFFLVTMLKFIEKIETIFSIGGCKGYSIEIDEKAEIVFNVECGKKIYKSNIFMPLNYQTKVGISYDGSVISFFLEGKNTNKLKTFFDLHYQRKMVLGKNSMYNQDYFSGKIHFIAFFNTPYGPRRQAMLAESGYKHPLKEKRETNLTLDDRLCISSCAKQATPGTAGSPKPPIPAITYKINGETSIIASNSDDSDDKDPTTNSNPYKEINCRTTAREVFKGDIKSGETKRVKCPKGCKKVKALIFGSVVYSFDSPICIASIHTGILTNLGGVAIVKVLPAMKFYNGSLQFGITSGSISKSDFSFSVESAPDVLPIKCDDPASKPEFAGALGKKFLVKCPHDCSKQNQNVFGNELYSGDSSICQAAIHSGNMNDRGGEIQFMIEKGQKNYFGLKAFGILSKDRDSYVKSIRFFSASDKLWKKYVESFKDKFVNKNWKIDDDLEADDYPSNWKFVKSKIPSETEFVLSQVSKIRSNKHYGYGSVITLKKTDIVNSEFKVSLWFVNLNPVGIIFRYKNEHNYYHLRLNNLGTFKMLLLKRYEGKDYTLGTSTYTITPRLWYNFTLLVYFDRFQVILQIGDIRNERVVFDVIDRDLQKGTIGIGTEGNDNFFAQRIILNNYDKRKSHFNVYFEQRNFDIIMRENTPQHRQKYCKTNYEGKLDEIINCKEFHNYCTERCNNEVHFRENILNFTCFRSCIKDAIMKEALSNRTLTEKISKIMVPEAWSPKEKEKCDFKPDNLGDNSSWIMCKITTVKSKPNDPEQKYIHIEYKQDDKYISSVILYPTITLKKCGAMINREDCDE